MTNRLISDSYRKAQEELHSAEADYGVASISMAPLLARMVERLKPGEILDYGAGKQQLASALSQHLPAMPPIQAYDPAVPAISSPPQPADLVACIDVLEHIEPDCLDAVLDDLRRVTRRMLFASIASGPARRTLSDGRNAHLIQQPMEWWLPRLWAKFRITAFNQLDGGRFWLTAVPRA